MDIEDKRNHLCATCRRDFAVCSGKNVVFSSDLNRDLKGCDADMVISCDRYGISQRSPNRIIDVDNING